jgi:membrane peptidoglycan carboxypeptidase
VRQLPPHVTGAFVSAEDARFYDHSGFDLTQIARSLEIDLREHRLARGGSTISQQLVKNAFLSQRRSFDRKLQEAILTWRLEARLTKSQILERYVNLIELGPRVFGLTAAARHWFNATPHELSVRQAAFLAALTSEPTSMSRRVRRAGGLDPDSAARVDVVLYAMRRDGVIDAAQLDGARLASLRFAPSALQQDR